VLYTPPAAGEQFIIAPCLTDETAGGSRRRFEADSVDGESSVHIARAQRVQNKHSLSASEADEPHIKHSWPHMIMFGNPSYVSSLVTSTAHSIVEEVGYESTYTFNLEDTE
jgi:hypothetical protein